MLLPRLSRTYIFLRLLEAASTWYLSAQHKPVPVPRKPSYEAGRHVSLVVPTVDTPNEFAASLRTWASAGPKEIIVVTVPHDAARVRALVAAALVPAGVPVTVLTHPRATKRGQLSCGIRHSTGAIIAVADDDTYWKPSVLAHLLAPFEDPSVGGVGGRGRAAAPPPGRHKWNCWEAAAALRNWRFGINEAANNALGGGCFVLSGRTALYRAEILRQDAFLYAFTHDYWLGKYLLDSGCVAPNLEAVLGEEPLVSSSWYCNGLN
ncbi:glycosyltransferase like family 2 domain-containing protein [Hirsutella rhossiliensis]|uniref:Glycosyltransferase like family 2 domain-containing protein n=1 Tax=Hirsutella rhossiliensis TaxID=111463 RepID=A0A9P8MW54_9HYPO|nr:glycosyltransferase like family 2 domain-containing protein [Hirsutella rhossiliensis]KAH0962365.1 glycosyltransferase like family 2 domain-containing protein [Hirsutella rhossiliensis]